MLLGPVVRILMFRVKGQYLSFGTLYEDKIYYMFIRHSWIQSVNKVQIIIFGVVGSISKV